MKNEIQLASIPDSQLAVHAAALAQRAREMLATIVEPEDGARFIHDVKAIKDRIGKLRLTEEEVFKAQFPWSMCWLEGMRRTGKLIADGQEAGTIALGGRRGAELGNKMLLNDLDIERIESSRWQRLAEIHPEDWRTFEEVLWDEGKQPTLMAALSLVNGEIDLERPWLRVYNVWNFQKRDERFGIEHPGNIPGQIIQNLNWYYTNPGDLIIDLFGGGGVSLDVCKSADDDYGNRKCTAYDIAPVREDIERRDLLIDGIPPTVGEAALVFLDPPYWSQKRGDYSSDPTNLANLELGAFHTVLEKIINDSLSAMKPGAFLALIMGASQQAGEYYDHSAEMIRRIQAPIVNRIIVPYSTQQYSAFDVTRNKKNKTTLNIYRDLIIWKK
jgi:hypothetical protein